MSPHPDKLTKKDIRFLQLFEARFNDLPRLRTLPPVDKGEAGTVSYFSEAADREEATLETELDEWTTEKDVAALVASEYIEDTTFRINSKTIWRPTLAGVAESV